MPVEDVLRSLGVDSRHGLSISIDVLERRKQYGTNEFATEEIEPIWKKFIDKLKEPMIALLLASATVSLLTAQYDDAISITLVSNSLIDIDILVTHSHSSVHTIKRFFLRCQLFV